MAPEQVRGDRRLICPATDVYGLGSTLYFLLLGRPPCVSTVTQEMLRLHSDDHSRVSFDANDYRALRIEELRLSAQAAADKYAKVLDLKEPLTHAGLKARYKELVKRHHPDTNNGDKGAEERFKRINQAYNTLKASLAIGADGQ